MNKKLVIICNSLDRLKLYDKLSFNEGMIIENIVAQMLVSGKRKLYFYSRNDRKDSSEKMEIDFLIAKNNITIIFLNVPLLFYGNFYGNTFQPSVISSPPPPVWQLLRLNLRSSFQDLRPLRNIRNG